MACASALAKRAREAAYTLTSDKKKTMLMFSAVLLVLRLSALTFYCGRENIQSCETTFLLGSHAGQSPGKAKKSHELGLVRSFQSKVKTRPGRGNAVPTGQRDD